MSEIWKDIPTYEGIYKVSNFGNVLSLNYNHTKRPKKLYPNNINGYKNVTLCNGKSKKSFGVHRLVFWAFYGLLSDRYRQIDHINGDKCDNRLKNLQMLTSRNNSIKDISKISETAIGVSKVGDKFRARISLNGKCKHLGYYSTEDEARMAYLKNL